MKVTIYRLSWSLRAEKYSKMTHKLICTETDKTYKDIEGKAGYATIIKKDKLGKIHSGIVYGETLTGFHYEVFCLEKDILHFDKTLTQKIKESFNMYYEGFEKMKKQLL